MNKKLLTPLFVAASFFLIGCSADTIVGRPDWINHQIIKGEDVDGNKMKEIYDAIKNLGDTNANVLNKIMYDITKKQVGSFVELQHFANDTVSDTDLEEFVKNHPVYKSDDQGGVIEGGEAVIKDLEPADKLKVSKIKIQQQYTNIVESIFEKLFNEIKDNSYSTDATFKLFSEENYIRHLDKELYEPVIGDIDITEGSQVFIPKQIDQTWRQYVNCVKASGSKELGFLHVMDGNGKLTSIYAKEVKDEDGNLVDYDGYIGRKILPDIYRELLVQTYVREQRTTNLGRSYARKVKMLTIPHGSYAKQIDDMLIDYAINHITGNDTITPTLGDLDELSRAMVGVADIETASTNYSLTRQHLEAGKFTKLKIPDTATDIQWKMSVDENGNPTVGDDDTPSTDAHSTFVFKGTKLGDLVEKFTKAYKLSAGTGKFGNFTFVPKTPVTEEVTSAYNDLTNNGAYPIEVALQIKEREALLTDMTQDGWFLKNGGLTDLNEEPRNRLFNILTSNQIDTETSTSYESGDYVRYFNIGGNEDAFLIKGITEEDKKWESVILDYGDNFYIVQVDEAASLAKLSYTDENGSYLNKKATAEITDSNKAMNDIINNVAKQVASGDTYKKNAEQYYLMISNILFYDQSVYDYFKSQFPELFK